MSWNLNAYLQLWRNNSSSTEIPIRFFMVEGGEKRGFMDNQVLHNNLEILLEFQDAVKYKNIIVGRAKDAFSGDIIKLSLNGKVNLDLRLIACVELQGKYESNQLELHMYGVRISSMGNSTVGAMGEVEKLRFDFDLGDVNISSASIGK